MIPGMQELLKSIRTLEAYARNHPSEKEQRILPLTEEEVDLIESFRRFNAQENWG
jgi:hypothetical protein